MKAAKMFFTVNLHLVDRLGRVAAGIGMMVAGWSAADGILAFTLRVFALYPLATGIMGWSPVYEILHFSTRPGEPRHKR